MVTRHVVLIVAAVSWACVQGWSSQGRAADYPTKPITLVVPFGPGGSIDIMARLLGQQLALNLGHPIVVENRPGAGTVTATNAIARATPDGHSLLITTSALAINESLHKSLPYNATADLVPVALVASIPLILVANPSLPVQTAADLIKLAKEKPGQLNYSSGGSGTAPHLAAEHFKSSSGTNMVHVPYKSGPAAVSDVVAGHVQLIFSDPGSAVSLIQEGKVRAIGVTSLVRIPSIPDTPPLTETGITNYQFVSWQMILAPAKTPSAIVSRLHSEFKSALANSEVRQKISGFGMLPVDCNRCAAHTLTVQAPIFA